MKPLAASSTDGNRSVFRTVTEGQPKLFWSSAGSEKADKEEYLDYEVAKLRDSEVMEIVDKGQLKSKGILALRGYALIDKF